MATVIKGFSPFFLQKFPGTNRDEIIDRNLLAIKQAIDQANVTITKNTTDITRIINGDIVINIATVAGPTGPPGLDADGGDGGDAVTFPGPPGARGRDGIGIPGSDGEDGDSFTPVGVNTSMARVWLSTPDPSFPNGVNMGALGQGVLQQTVTAGVATPYIFASGSARVPFGSGTAGALTDSANFTYNVATNQFTVGGAAPIAFPSTIDATASAGSAFIVAHTASLGAADYSGFVMYLGANFTGPPYFQFLVPTLANTTFGPSGTVILDGNSTGTGNFRIGNSNGFNGVDFYTSAARVSRLFIATGGNVSITNLAAGGVVYATAGTGVLKIGTPAEVASAITWPAAGRVLVSSGTTTAPIGNSAFQWDDATRVLYMGTGSSQSWSNVGNFGAANDERVTVSWGTFAATTSWILKSEKTGAGTLRPMVLNADTSALYLVASGATGQVNLGNNPAVTPSVQGTATQVKFKGDITQVAAAGMTLDAFQFGSGTGITFTGATHVTTIAGVNLVAINAVTYTTGAVVDFGASLAIYGAPSGPTNAYALWVQSGTTVLAGDVKLAGSAAKLGFYGNTGTAQATVTGSRGGNAALLSLLNVLSGYGMLVDSSGP